MPIGSVTKTFTAVAILQLVERGEVALDAPVRTYLPWFTVRDPAASRRITVRQLLNHTSGLSDAGYNRVLASATSLEEGVRDLRHAKVTAPVGTTYQYFNPNYATLALVIEKVSGLSYGDYLTRNIIEPLGLRHTYGHYPDAVAAGIAQGHVKLFGFPVAVDQPFDRWRVGADSVVSTAPDLARLAVAVAGDGSMDGRRLLSPESVALMWTAPHGASTGYGLGWEIGRHRGETAGGHGGADPAFTAEMAVLRDSGRGYVLLLNSQHMVDLMVAVPQIRVGMLDLLQDRTPTDAGVSARTVGLALLLLTAVVVALTVRSALRLRGWRQRAEAMSPRQLVLAVAPHFLVPLLLVVGVYQVSLLVIGRAFNLRYVGMYFVPDVVVLLALAVVPDIVIGLYMLATALLDRRRSTRPDAPAELPPVQASQGR